MSDVERLTFTGKDLLNGSILRRRDIKNTLGRFHRGDNVATLDHLASLDV